MVVIIFALFCFPVCIWWGATRKPWEFYNFELDDASSEFLKDDSYSKNSSTLCLDSFVTNSQVKPLENPNHLKKGDYSYPNPCNDNKNKKFVIDYD